MTSLRACIVPLAFATIAPVSAANAQAADCTYDRCALRLQSRIFSQLVVQGTGATSVGRLGLFAPRIEPLESAGDSARMHYESFRSHENRGGALSLVGGLASLAAGIVWGSSGDRWGDPPGAAWGLFGVGLAFSIAGGIDITKGRDHLHQAMWFYNRDLVAAP